ncbi:NUDIX hydrolase [Streptomyces sp. NPDC048297]|uniref:NUDIX hydrolase n=1 Tax=Streptomyces sp. NPDC048297 TaxID=3365531 RepID=UPI003716D432
MTLDQAAGAVVQAVVVYDGQLLLVARGEDWVLPSGTAEPAESAEATAARIVYELTGYLVDGSQPLEHRGEGAEDAIPAVVCQLLTRSPSEGASLTADQLRWCPFAEAIGSPLPAAVRAYLRGHTPV